MKRLIPLLLLALIASACKIRVDTNVVINEDESGTFALEISLDEELRALAEDDPSFGALTVTEDVPEGWVLEDFVDGEFEGVRASTTFDDFEGFERRLAEYAETAGAEDNVAPDFLSQLEINREGDIFSFRADLTGLEAGLGAAIGGEDDLGVDPAAFIAELFEIRLILTMPGSVVASNADATAGTTLTWDISIVDDGRVLEAQSDVGGSAGGPIIGLIVLAAVIAAVVFIVLQRRNQQRTEEPAAAEVSGE